MSVVTKQLRRDDVDLVVNACDAGREGELIFAYLYEKAGAKKPVRRLWLSSMTNAAMKEAFASLRPAEELQTLEQAARSRSEADWIVGMNATRAATIRLRSSFDGAVSLGRVQTPTLAIVARREEEIRAFVPEPYWLVDARFEAPARDGLDARAYAGRYHAGAKPRIATEASTVRSPRSRRRSRPSARRCSTTSRRCSATPTRASGSRRGGRWRRPSASTRSTRRSRTRAPARAI
jgi:DNA topoisomerase-3